MMSVTSKTIDFAGKNLVSCGCSSNASFDRYTVRSPSRVSSKGCGKVHGACKLFCCTKRNTQCRVSSMKTAEPTVDGGTHAIEGLNKGLNLKGYSEAPISAARFFEAVADDLLTLNKNLQSVSNVSEMSAFWCFIYHELCVIVVARELTVKHRRLAEIIEMIHTASLIHDDVLDESDLRRGKKTMHQIFGTRVAVLAGDFMFAQSSWYLANLENIEVIKLISQVIKDFASGEIKQASSLFDCDVQLEEYLIKSYYKTASLIAASSKGAAIFSGADSGITEKMYEYGRNLGLSFQIVDDILDFTQSAEQLGKPSGSDLAKGNLTAPVIFALEKEPKLRDIIESEFSEGGSLDEAINMVKSCGSIERAQELAKEKADLAIQSLQCLPQNVYRLALEDMVAYNLQRIA
ncbi:hypothetical protein V8G54_026160 [Vigna mungo]|uniref:Solanesyl diphosphate synthase n=1 Tax=Vigna mungo TaxID=3915 RepID=A0AAQ3RQ92_VIGMU